MTDEQLTRLFFRLLKAMPVHELYSAALYAVEGPSPTMREPNHPADGLSLTVAETIVEIAREASAHKGAPCATLAATIEYRLGRERERDDVIDFIQNPPGRIPDGARQNLAELVTALRAGRHERRQGSPSGPSECNT